MHGEVGQDKSIDAYLLAFFAKGLHTKLQDGIEVAHEDNWQVDGLPKALQLFEEFFDAHPVF